MVKVEDFMKTETFKKAEEISKKSITEMVLMQDKANAYDLLVEPLTELIFKYKEDDSLGSYEKHLYGIIESILSDKETTQFTCGSCGEKWNLISPKSDSDTCPGCGITVYSDIKRTKECC